MGFDRLSTDGLGLGVLTESIIIDIVPEAGSVVLLILCIVIRPPPEQCSVF